MLPIAKDKGNSAKAPGEQTEEAQRIAQVIHSAGMGEVAKVALETLKPLHWIAGQFAWALQPFLGSFGPFSKRGATPIDSMARLLEREGGVSELTMHIDTLLDEKRSEKAGEGTKR